MNYIIVSDIYGLTAPFKRLLDNIQVTSVAIDPYNGQLQLIDSEKYYYNKFINDCGHDNYAAKLLNVFNNLKEPATCIGFSAGASAAWRAQLLTGNPHLKKLIGFYPSQIRNHLDISAKVPCTFIFPHTEKHFNVDEVISALASKNQVTCNKTPFLHGFMNAYSANYDGNAYDEYCALIKSL
ncbi:dienelactone hydrolase family protein [Pseudoalteromonas sp. P1-7a]|uniref:dienelactone hydrolase family protein n=1 Tax=Pseudoalteromonas sp. P1-7a TaxID=1723755 RepID=UPI0006D65DAD|nr:dienelactone hydrolase family protein [Pseudoalteromonas sp. P1-7a]KPZ58573.1 hypothetical protein AN389_03039 [Pseudoalteromonas sp. P1-7a]